jgi:hypothetical protein
VCQGFQSGQVFGTLTRLRSCIVPAEIAEPPKISGVQNHKYDRLVEYFSGEFSNFCRYYTRSQTGKSTEYLPTLKPLAHYHITLCDDYKIFKFVSFSCGFFSDFIDNHRFTGHLSHNDKGMSVDVD